MQDHENSEYQNVSEAVQDLEQHTVSDEQTTDVTVPESDSSKEQKLSEEEKALKKKEKMGKFKEKMIEKGKDSIISVILKKIVGCVLSAILSAALVLFTQFSFKDNIQDYRTFYNSEIKTRGEELLSYVPKIEKMDSQEFAKYCEQNHVYEKATELLKKLYSYSSDDEDINLMHKHITAIYEDVYDLALLAYSDGYTEGDLSGMMRATALKITSKVQIFKEVKAEIYQKHKISE